MGIARPYEVETGQLQPSDEVHLPLDLSARMETLVQSVPNGLRIDGRTLRLPPGFDPKSFALELRTAMIERFRERRPDATEHTWRGFTRVLHGLLKQRALVDRDLCRALFETIDGL